MSVEHFEARRLVLAQESPLAFPGTVMKKVGGPQVQVPRPSKGTRSDPNGLSLGPGRRSNNVSDPPAFDS